MNSIEPFIRDLRQEEIPALAGFAPEDWKVELDAVVLQHFGRPYFNARVTPGEAGIAAFAQGVVTGDTGWLGNIIVRPGSRRRGLGHGMTLDLVDLLRDHGCRRLLLIATELGEPVYRRVGFRQAGEYVFLDAPRLTLPDALRLHRLGPEDAPAVNELDRAATGEMRSELLAPYLAQGWGHLGTRDELDGFFLPSFGSGLVIAGNPTAGTALLRVKHSLYRLGAVVPSTNDVAIRFLLAAGAREVLRAPRMALGDEAEWRPDWVFARATGYCG